jgi:redox-sensitive bicupin YhaK (pirin superfamily)
MIQIRKAHERGHFDHGWLKTFHTFSFARYFDPRFSGFRSLRVINEDWIQPGAEFPTHPHRDMEIVTYLIAGELAHKDSMGNGSVIKPGEVQRMTAGSGVTHSESNPSTTETTHMLQIWILPDQKGLTPDYDQHRIDEADKLGRWCPVIGPRGQTDTISINQDAFIYTAVLKAGDKLERALEEDRHGWLQVVAGAVELNGHRLDQGDGAALSREQTIRLSAAERSEVLFFDLA